MPSLTADIPKSGRNLLRPVSLFHKKLYCRRKASGPCGSFISRKAGASLLYSSCRLAALIHLPHPAYRYIFHLPAASFTDTYSIAVSSFHLNHFRCHFVFIAYHDNPFRETVQPASSPEVDFERPSFHPLRFQKRSRPGQSRSGTQSQVLMQFRSRPGILCREEGGSPFLPGSEDRLRHRC